ncbi:exonuclease domain-containing protein [Mycobacterium sp. RTGN5]|uniref:exonuclease domain-containing protein n=1 Tax=Mycobacterium sp. RTGN5 TaxID=3016522 RepID=UPI0029C6E7D0|nr:exonuclease domain-containing protein [Mycobacterium sp. RTGN5]
MGLANLLGREGRVAVIDVETTGLYRTDRVVEVAVVTVNADGAIEEEFDTLVNPMRDMGATWIHGIDTAMVRDAPTFADVAHHVAARINGAVVTGHNVRFDMRMLGDEFDRAGIDIDWGTGLDTLSVTGCKLSQACIDHEIVLDGAHCALDDARATAKLMLRLCGSFDESPLPASARPLMVTAMQVCRRDGKAHVQPPQTYLASLAKGIHTTPDVAPYVALLDVAIADLRLTANERAELHVLAADLGLDDLAIARAHRDFLTGLIDAAVEDGIVTDDELNQLCRAAALLEVDVEHVAGRTDQFRAIKTELELSAGLTVCFTGEGCDQHGTPIERTDQIRFAEDHGLVVVKSVTKSGPNLLVAADAGSRSEKARKARRNGTPVTSYAAFATALATGRALAVSQMVSSGVALVCTECGDSWIASRRLSTPVCADCS